VYVIVAVPAATAVTTPEEAFTVATVASSLVHAPPASPFELNVVVPLEQIACVPLNVPALGAVVTVTVLIAVSFAQPPVPVTIYLMVVVPAATAVTTPVLASTVATPVFTELNDPVRSPSVTNVVVPSEHIACVPESIPALGSVVTVTVLVAVTSTQPPVPVTVYVIVEVPAATAVTTPEEAFTVATVASSLVHTPPASPFELNVVVPFEQIACVPLSVPALGAAVTVTVLVAVSFAHPPVPVTMYLMVVVPAATAVTTPVVASTVATPVFTELNAPASPSEENVVVPSEHTDCVPESTPALGSVVTVTVLVAVASAQPPVPVTVYVIVAVPAATAVTTPVEAFTVAKLVLSLVHAPPASPFELNVVVPLEQIACVPLNVPALGAAVTVTVLIAVSFAHPPVPVTMYLMVVVPAATGVMTPAEAFTVATPVLAELHAPLSPSEENVVVPSEHTD
jgi:hypothetical protein